MKMENSIRKQTLTINLDSESDAMQLQGRLPDINREKLLPIIERVLEEISVPGQRIRIDRLQIDLGTLSFNRFTEEMELRLDAALRQRLQDIVTKKNNTGSASLQTNVFFEPLQHSRLRLLEYYLINGVLPWHTHHKHDFSCETLFVTLAEEQQNSMVDVIVKHYRLPQVIERLVLQLTDDSLRKLLHLLEPHNADLILAYILDLGMTHTLHPVVPINAGDFNRLVWFLTLAYSMRERGTQFNRKSYLKSLIQGMAQSEGLKYNELVVALHLGLKKIIKKGPLKSTLPALIAALAEENNAIDNMSSFADAADDEPALSSALIPSDPLTLWDNIPTNSAPRLADTRGTESANTVFLRYDRFDLLCYYLNHGTFCHHHPCIDPRPSLTELITFLTQFPLSWITTIFDVNDKKHQSTVIFRAVELLPEIELLRLLKKWFPMDEGHGENFYASVGAIAKLAKNKTFYYSRLLCALLNGQSLDLEQFSAADDEKLTSIYTGQSAEAHSGKSDEKHHHHYDENCNIHKNSQEVKARFLSILQQFTSVKPELTVYESDPGEVKTAVKLLQILLVDYPVDSHHFLLDIQATPELADNVFNPFLEKISTTEFENVLRQVQPEIFNVSKTLAEILLSIPVPYRPGLRKLRSVILAAALLFKHSASENFFTQVLRELFPTPLPKSLAEHLFASAESWRQDDDQTEEQINNFNAAISRCLSDDLLHQKKNHHAPLADEQEDQLTEWQNRVFSTLLPQYILRLSKYAGLKNLEAISREELPEAINRLLARLPDNVRSFVREHIVYQPVREYWIDILPESSLVRFIWLLEPQQLRALLNSAEILASAQWEVAGERGGECREFWLFLLNFFSSHSGSNCTLSAMTSAFFNYFVFAHDFSIENKKVPLVKVEPGDLLDKTRQLASERGERQLLAILDKNRKALLAPKEERKIPADEKLALQKPARSAGPVHPLFKDKNDTKGMEECLYIDNAGLVLLGAFLPHLFKSLDMLHTNTQGKVRLRDKATINRAVHMLQYLVNGSTSTHEALLPLNKILCGESIHIAIERSIELTKEELRICEQLHNSVLASWASLSGTSIMGLQQTFLQREGRLVQTDDRWKLTVQRKTVDVLMDQVSWSISVISHAWMPKPLYVSWQ